MNSVPLDGKLYLDPSRIYRSGIDEDYYWSNLLYDLIREWSFKARAFGDEAIQDITRCMATEKLDEQHYYAFFAGVAARRAFSVAARLLELDQERQTYLNNKPMVWRV